MKIGWKLTKLLQKLSGLLCFGPPCFVCRKVFYVRRVGNDIINTGDVIVNGNICGVDGTLAADWSQSRNACTVYSKGRRQDNNTRL